MAFLQSVPKGANNEVIPDLGILGLMAASGDLEGFSTVHKFGRNPDIDTASGFEALWNGGGDYTGHDATAAELVELFSSDAADAAAGTGARTVEIHGLDENYDLIQETVTLNGVTGVDTVNTFIRVMRLIVLTAGSGNANAGLITARQKVTTANIFAVMPIGNNQTMIAAYTVPAGKRAFIFDWFAAMSNKTAGAVDVRLLVRSEGGVFRVIEEIALNALGTGYEQRDYKLAKDSILEKSDIKIMVDTDTNNIGVAGGFDLLIVDN